MPAEDVEPNGGEVSDVMSENDNEYDDPDTQIKDEDETMADANASFTDGTTEGKKKYDPKDPLRPRRKKARRACYACQRAHLTCGDERPCQRCIKRGLADACQDGVRKKAKYLHDAPPEALRPVLGPNYNPSPPSTRPSGQRHASSTGSDTSTVGTFFPQTSNNGSTYPVFSAPPSMAGLPGGITFGSQQSPVSPSFQTNPQLGSMTVPQMTDNNLNLTNALFDPSNPAIFNFNLDGLNFGSTYGAMEFGMLGHMASGAADTPPRDHGSMSQQGVGDANFGSAGVFNNGVSHFDKVYESGMIGDLFGLDQTTNGLYSQGNLQHGLPHAYAIAAGPNGLQSPSTETNSPQPAHGSESSPQTTSLTAAGAANSQMLARSKGKPSTAPKFGPPSILGKRQRDPSYIYDTVKEPYLYVKGFHDLIALLQARFSGAKLTSIAKSLGSIRPAFISCTRTLSRQDLVHMEKSFQRGLLEYEDFMFAGSSPAILCRRTGEVAAVNKEFTALTGWTKDVLLGKEPNLNINTGGTDSVPQSGSGTGRAGLSTPRLKSLNDAVKAGEGKPRPIFLPELMDDESVIQFYQDFAHLAFGDSRGSVMRKCRLLKYRTKESLHGSASGSTLQDSPQKGARGNSILSSRVARIDGEHGISKIEKGGKLECSYTWFVKRDLFDIPMMMVMNFLPCYYPDQEPHQLAV